MTQRPLFSDAPARSHDGLPPFQRHSDTSRAAAIAIMPKVGTKRRLVLDYIKSSTDYGATDEEIQVALRMDGNTERPRRVELLGDPDKGLPTLIADSGRTRRGFSGQAAVVWVAK